MMIDRAWESGMVSWRTVLMMLEVEQELVVLRLKMILLASSPSPGIIQKHRTIRSIGRSR